MGKKKTLSEGRMNQLWRKVILINAKNRCYICNKYFPDEGLEAHHIIRRVKKITRWMPINGVALCHACHRDLHNQNKVKRELETSWEHIDELDQLNLSTYKDYLVDHNLTHEENYNRIANILKEKIQEFN